MKIQIPKNAEDGTDELDMELGLVIVGANGAGKTRFGSKIEQLNPNSKRISAQRILQITETIPKQDFDESFRILLQLYKNKSPVVQQNDYEQLLISIFSEESKRDSDYVKTARNTDIKPVIPDSVIDKIIKIWDGVFPHIKIILEDNKVRAKEPVESSTPYSGTEMSDGEKVGLYLISQVLVAEKDSLIIIDEPELHLHKALMVRLWNTLESFRPDCQFIYITHDLDFAVSKSISQKIWIRDYVNNKWTWEFIENKGILPEELYIEVAGSREPVIFVEGDKGSLDYKIYQIVYSDFTIIPVGSCSKVIEVVKGFRTAKYLHDIKVCGIIDRDFRSNKELEVLKNDKIFSIKYIEVENILLSPEVTDYISNLLSKDAKATKDQIKAIVKKRIEDQIELLSFKKLKSNISYYSQNEISKSTNVESVFKGLSNILEHKKAIISDCQKIFDNAKDSDDIDQMLAVFPEKGLSNQIAEVFDLKNSSTKPYISLILRKLNTDADLKEKLKLKLPEIKEGLL